MEVSLAEIEQIEDLSVLFNQYRVFYQQSSDLEAARTFLEERFQNKDSVVLIANHEGKIVGFVQLYPSFSSVSMKRIWILNDLFVREGDRRKGVAKLLLLAAEKYARKTGAIRVTLATQKSNLAAQTLYESQGYAKDEEFYHYGRRL